MKTKELVLNELVKHLNQNISGESLAKTLNLSRTAIWKAIHKLINDGYEISSATNKGYCLHMPWRLSKEVIEYFLLKKTPIKHVEFKETTDSTQNDAKRFSLNNKKEVLVLSDYQTAGKGRFGRSYFTYAQKGFYMSLLIFPKKTFLEISQYTLLTAVAVVRAIENLTDKRPLIKWINDIYLNDKKICGILSEAVTNVESNQITSVIIGIGLNFSIQQEEFPKELQKKATSLFADTKPSVSRNELIVEIWNQFYQLMNIDFIEIYRQRSFVLGKQVSFVEENKTYQGVAKQITDTGQLEVLLNDGNLKSLNAGEISLQSIRNLLTISER
ncbi:MAG: biotin--[acetyl-CoA-carboxylase] ligase [Lactobacillales bacterium]|jgi:BirA family biotin operon repressor/biotin-[acetyl-CoA-carboxylase] ligase|nr:biotin--[acetyl-CoA-carboxylase] ligase [Lactobacillales bacterium]